MKKAAVLLLITSLALGGIAAAQTSSGRFSGKIDTHEFDIPVECQFTQMGKAVWLTASTDGNQLEPLEDTNNDGIAGQINTALGGSNKNAAVHIKLGNDEYKFAGSKTVQYRDKGFSWKTTIEDYDNEKRQEYLEAGKSLNDLAPERTYEVDVNLECQ